MRHFQSLYFTTLTVELHAFLFPIVHTLHLVRPSLVKMIPEAFLGCNIKYRE